MIFKKNGNIVETLGDIRLFVEATDLGGTRQLRLPKEGRNMWAGDALNEPSKPRWAE
jgi:hypothetical protein